MSMTTKETRVEIEQASLYLDRLRRALDAGRLSQEAREQLRETRRALGRMWTVSD